MTHPIINTKKLDFQWETQNPFLFCVHHRDIYPPGNEVQGLNPNQLRGRKLGSDFNLKDGYRMYHGNVVPGFPAHPHRGFETVTVVLEGLIDHTDSLGGSGRYGNGDVQWMTAGHGIQHCEMFPLVSAEEENKNEFFQLWLNLPASSKMVEPCYKMLWAENVPIVDYPDENGKNTRVRIVAGAIGDIHADQCTPNSWAADETNEVFIFVIDMEAGARFTLPISSSDVNRTLYAFAGGSITIQGTTVTAQKGINLHAHIETTIEMGEESGRLLLLQGRPINEPVAQHGPFVMNTKKRNHGSLFRLSKNSIRRLAILKQRPSPSKRQRKIRQILRWIRRNP
jgi:redox-sensitive bicupin YhaK (pirin superfamily)